MNGQQENEEIVRDFIDTLNGENFLKLEDMIHDAFAFFPEGVEYYKYYREIAPNVPDFDTTKAGWINRLKYNQKHLSGLKRIILKIMSSDDEVWVWTKRQGLHNSDFDGFPASGKMIDIYSFVMYQIKDRKIFRSFNLDDDLMGFIQVGKVILEENDGLKVSQYMSQLRKIGLIK